MCMASFLAKKKKNTEGIDQGIVQYKLLKKY